MNSNYKFKLPVKKFDSYVNEPNNDKHNRGVQESYGRTRLGEGGRAGGREGGRAGGREEGMEGQVREGGEGGRRGGKVERETMTSRLQKAHCN